MASIDATTAQRKAEIYYEVAKRFDQELVTENESYQGVIIRQWAKKLEENTYNKTNLPIKNNSSTLQRIQKQSSLQAALS